MPTTEAAIDASLMRDVYVALGEPIADGSNQWALRIYVKPLIRWIWLGAIIMALGGLISMLDKRYRIKKVKAPLLVTGDLATDGVNEVAIEQAISASTMSTLKEK
jgi:cytochrome c-type biogenesis protein CcmF